MSCEFRQYIYTTVAGGLVTVFVLVVVLVAVVVLLSPCFQQL